VLFGKLINVCRFSIKMTKIERINSFLNVIKNVVVTGSIIAAGFWAYYQFPILNNDLVNRKPLMTAEMSISQKHLYDKLFLKVDIDIFNKGNDPMWLEFPSPPLTIFLVKYINGDPNHSIVKTSKFESYHDIKPKTFNLPKLVISQNSKFKFPFLVPIEIGGVYYVVFHAIRRNSYDKEILKGMKYPKNAVLSLQASDYVLVKK
jgi:hypothetical protein